MNILVLGSGGREHALCWKIAASPLVTKLWCAPGNAGIAQDAECVALDVTDHAAVIEFCRANKMDLVVVGPERARDDVGVAAHEDLLLRGGRGGGPEQRQRDERERRPHVRSSRGAIVSTKEVS